jgi:hypothetical protein
MASSSIGTYTEKKLHSKIKQLKKQVDDLETFIKNPPYIMITGMMDIPSDYTSDWKKQITFILNENNINMNWVLDTINPDIKNQMPYSVTIQFISHCVKDVVYKTLVDYITNNEYDSVTIIKDLI